MTTAAVPAYMGKDFRSASPGLRFTYFLDIWTERSDQEAEVRKESGKKSREAEALNRVLSQNGMDAAIEHIRNRRNFPRLWEKNDFVSRKVWRKIVELNEDDRGRLSALRSRQMVMIAPFGQASLSLHAVSTAPFATGLGNEHPLENGFAFLWPYGLPYLPGSGVKGVVRRAAQELAEGLWGETHGWSNEACCEYPAKPTGERGEMPRLSMIDLLFGREPPSGDSDHFRGCLTFWDVFPQIHGNKLRVEIMTPHQKHYYQAGEAPHDSGMPVPISFLSIPPKSQFTFHVVCNTQRLEKLAPELVNQWQDLLRAAFQHAFEWLGFGAKTAVGYGVMERDKKAEAAAREEREKLEKEARKSSMSEEERKIEDLRELYEKEKATGRLQPNGPVAERRVKLLEETLQWEDPELRRKAGELLRQIAKDLKWPKRREREAKAQVRELLGEAP